MSLDSQNESSPEQSGTQMSNAHPGMKLLLILGLALTGTVLFSILGIVLIALIYHVNLIANPGLMNNVEDPNVVAALKLLQTASALGTFVLPSVVYARMNDKRPFKFLNLNRIPRLVWAGIAFCLTICASPLINLMSELNSRMVLPGFLSGVEKWMKESEAQAEKMTEAFMNVDGITGLVINLFIIGLLAAVGEELLFRGVLQRILKEWMKNTHAAVWLTAIIFSAIHMQFFGFLPRMVIGAMLGYLYEWSGSLFIPMVAHFTNNAFSVVVTYLIQHKSLPKQADNVGSTSDDLMYIIISLVLCSGLVFLALRLKKSPVSVSS
jgi:membrane protease YdiL (CAAX protease family)